MSTITKEQAKDLRNAFQCWQQYYDPVEDKEQYDMFGLAMVAMDALLASLDAEPVYQLWDEGYYDTEKGTYNAVLMAGGRGRIVYTAPPAPVSVPDAYVRDERGRMMLNGRQEPRIGYSAGWNACRAAMLQGADGNSPVIPDGWVMVPVEPTEDMIVNGFESEPDESFSDEKEWEVYEAMSGCQQAAHRAKLSWAAMISAAPKI